MDELWISGPLSIFKITIWYFRLLLYFVFVLFFKLSFFVKETTTLCSHSLHNLSMKQPPMWPRCTWKWFHRREPPQKPFWSDTQLDTQPKKLYDFRSCAPLIYTTQLAKNRWLPTAAAISLTSWPMSVSLQYSLTPPRQICKSATTHEKLQPITWTHTSQCCWQKKFYTPLTFTHNPKDFKFIHHITDVRDLHEVKRCVVWGARSSGAGGPATERQAAASWWPLRAAVRLEAIVSDACLLQTGFTCTETQHAI